MNCLVTGATGFIGAALCQALRGRGDTVRPYSRSGAALPDGTPTRAVDLRQARLGLPDLGGIDVVFHLAGVAHQQAEDSAYDELNVQATRALADACLCAGVGHFVFLSSVKAMGPSRTDAPRGEQDCEPPQDAYGRSKLTAENDLVALCRGRMAVTLIRPALVYAGDAKGNLALLDRWARPGLPRPPRAGARSMIARDDLVALLCQVAERSGVDARTWIATDGHSYSSCDIHDALRAARGLAPARDWAPRWLWRLGCSALDVLRPRAAPHWDKLFGTALYSNAAVLQDTNWRPQHSLADVFPARPDAA